MLELPTPGPERSIWELDDLSQLEGRAIATASHCFGCTAGRGFELRRGDLVNGTGPA